MEPLNNSLVGKKSIVSSVGISGPNVQHNRVEDVLQHDTDFEFWARQLIPFLHPAAVIFASFVNGKFNRLQLIEVVKTLKQMDYFEAVESVNFLPQPNFVMVKFDSPGMVEVFKDTVSQIDKLPIRFVDPSSLISTCFITVTNIPAELIPTLIGSQLKPWGTILKIFPQYIPKKNGPGVQIGQTRFEFKLHKECSIADIPYVLRVVGFKVFLYIRGRGKICFRCSSSSHLVSSCPVRYCGLCRALKVVGHDCVLSYAAAAKGPTVDLDVSLMHDGLLEQLHHVDADAVDVADVHSDLLENSESSRPDPGAIAGLDGPASSDCMQVSQESNFKRVRTRSVSRSERRRADLIVVADRESIEIPKEKSRSSRKNKKRAKTEVLKPPSRKEKQKKGPVEQVHVDELECCGKGEPSLSKVVSGLPARDLASGESKSVGSTPSHDSDAFSDGQEILDSSNSEDSDVGTD